MQLETRTDRLLLYRQEPDNILNRILQGKLDETLLAQGLSALLEQAYALGWQGNLWHRYLTHRLVMQENPFSLSRERRTGEKDSLWALALEDIRLFWDWFHLGIQHPAWKAVADFSSPLTADRDLEWEAELSKELAGAECPEKMLEALAAYYCRQGCGCFAGAAAFRVTGSAEAPSFEPISGEGGIGFDTLVGYDSQKKLLRENTEAFLAGHHANNVLLYGDAGTGKSTSIQALAGEYGDQGLRIIEVYKSQFSAIPAILSALRNRNYRFILCLDDLSFEETEYEYKFLKAVMEGGAGAAPENVRIYATSNRRHIVRETWGDRSDMQHDNDIHRSDTMEEKLSLAGRFGLQIFYPAPDFEQYQKIVAELAKRQGEIPLSREALHKAAATWQVRQGSRSGRTAKQFVDSLIKS